MLLLPLACVNKPTVFGIYLLIGPNKTAKKKKIEDKSTLLDYNKPLLFSLIFITRLYSSALEIYSRAFYKQLINPCSTLISKESVSSLLKRQM